jgi:peptidoglycan hydrolase-like protein with peptidoglycan-binding domain
MSHSGRVLLVLMLAFTFAQGSRRGSAFARGAEDPQQAIAPAVERKTIEAVQRALEERGLLEGEERGVLDEATRTAVARFQARVDLEPTGLPDAETVRRLIAAAPCNEQPDGL